MIIRRLGQDRDQGQRPGQDPDRDLIHARGDDIDTDHQAPTREMVERTNAIGITVVRRPVIERELNKSDQINIENAAAAGAQVEVRVVQELIRIENVIEIDPTVKVALRLRDEGICQLAQVPAMIDTKQKLNGIASLNRNFFFLAKKPRLYKA